MIISKVKSEIEIVEANKEDHAKVLDFLMKNYPTFGWSEEFMQLQYYDNPAGMKRSGMN